MIKLWENGAPYFDASFGQEEPNLAPYLIEDGKIHPAVIVFPGGGYSHRAYHEGEPVAQWLNSIGLHAFVLQYRVNPYTYPAILNDALRAVRLVRYKAAEFRIDPNKIGTLGFSAGGHLASCTAFCYDLAELDENDPVDRVSSRTDCAVLCYPVLSFVRFSHVPSAQNFMGKEYGERRVLRRFSPEENVTENTPPIFMWHTEADLSVPTENSLQLAMALQEKNIPYSLHIYPFGGHGQGLAQNLPLAAEWTTSCAAFLGKIFEMEKE